MASRNVWIAVAVIIIVVVVGSVGYYWWTLQSRPGSTPTSVTLYEGDRTGATGLQYLFGLSNNSLTSPGPQLNFTVNERVKMTVYNVGSLPHNWAIVSSKSDTTSVLFGAQIQSATNPIQPGSSSSVTFTVTQAGTFFYVCQVPGHVDVGMWGTVVVT